MLEQIKSRAKELLSSGTVKVVLGYKKGDNPQLAQPAFITKPEEVEQLIWDKCCIPTLAKYPVRPEIKRLGKSAVIAKGCDIKGLVGLIQEKQIARKDIYIMGVVCEGMGEPLLEKCKSCAVKKPPLFDELLGADTSGVMSPASETQDAKHTTQDDLISELERQSPQERWSFWQKELNRCIKCYACRQVCPLCYCIRCIADKNQPQWVPTTSHPSGNFFWNITRAYHLAGRCTGCGECERVCPMNIPLMLLNKKIEKVIKDKFGYQAGMDPEATPPLATYKEGDSENFIM
jgi:ferredoxin